MVRAHYSHKFYRVVFHWSEREQTFKSLQNSSKNLSLSEQYFGLDVYDSSDFQLTLVPVGWGCGIHRLRLCSGVRLHQRGESYPSDTFDTKQSDAEASVMGNEEKHFIAIAFRSTLARSGSTW